MQKLLCLGGRVHRWTFLGWYNWSGPQTATVPSGKRLHSYGKSPCSMGKSTISMAIFTSYVSHYQRVHCLSSQNLKKFLAMAPGGHPRSILPQGGLCATAIVGADFLGAPWNGPLQGVQWQKVHGSILILNQALKSHSYYACAVHKVWILGAQRNFHRN